MESSTKFYYLLLPLQSIFSSIFLGVAFGYPDAKGFGGTTTTAQVARTIFASPILRRRLVNLCPEVYRPIMAKILLNDLILLRLMSCSYLLLPSKIGK